MLQNQVLNQGRNYKGRMPQSIKFLLHKKLYVRDFLRYTATTN